MLILTGQMLLKGIKRDWINEIWRPGKRKLCEFLIKETDAALMCILV